MFKDWYILETTRYLPDHQNSGGKVAFLLPRSSRPEDSGLLPLHEEAVLARNDSLKPRNNESYVLL